MNYSLVILHSSVTGEKVRVKWYGTSVIYRVREGL